MTPFPLRIASYNIRKAMGTDRKRDPARILRIVKDMAPDIIALQEVDLRLPPRLPVFVADQIEAQCGLRPIEFESETPSLGWHGNAILLHPKFEVTAHGHLNLPGLEPRGLVWVEVRSGAAAFRMVGVHLGLLRASRRRQLSALLQTWPQEGDLPTLIAGDFNERSLAVGLGRLSRRFEIRDGGPSYHARHPIFALDRVAFTRSFTLRDISVFKNHETALASDHLPLVATLDLNPALLPDAVAGRG